MVLIRELEGCMYASCVYLWLLCTHFESIWVISVVTARNYRTSAMTDIQGMPVQSSGNRSLLPSLPTLSMLRQW